MERGENVLVAAHTSAGKTAIAEYAIARALKDGERSVTQYGLLIRSGVLFISH